MLDAAVERTNASRDDDRQNDQPSNVYGSRFSRLSDCSSTFSTARNPSRIW